MSLYDDDSGLAEYEEALMLTVARERLASLIIAPPPPRKRKLFPAGGSDVGNRVGRDPRTTVQLRAADWALRKAYGRYRMAQQGRISQSRHGKVLSTYQIRQRQQAGRP